jgi:hypothetical protein
LIFSFIFLILKSYQMSQFKIETIHPESTLEGRALRLPMLPPLNFNLHHMSLLTYDLE